MKNSNTMEIRTLVIRPIMNPKNRAIRTVIMRGQWVNCSSTTQPITDTMVEVTMRKANKYFISAPPFFKIEVIQVFHSLKNFLSFFNRRAFRRLHDKNQNHIIALEYSYHASGDTTKF